MATATTLTALVKEAAAAFPTRRAVAVPGKLELTHAALDALVEAAAARLAAEAGVLPGHVVALCFPNTVELAIMLLAVIRARAVAAPLNPAYTQEEFEFYLSDLEARLLVTSAEGNAAAQAAAAKLGLAHAAASLPDAAGPVHLAGLPKAANGDCTGAQAAAAFANDPSDVALFLHTSGTTSRPKGVPLTQANLHIGRIGVMDDEGILHINRSGQAHDVVIIVGAGPSGLAVAACLHSMGIPYMILERGNIIAPLWRNNGGFMLPLPKEFYGLPLMAFPDHYPEFITFGQYVEYLVAYAARFEINPEFNTTVKSARYDATSGLWHVRAAVPEVGEMVYTCRRLVVATGEKGDRVMPNIPGLAGFIEAGKVTHVGDYRLVEAYRGQRVLIVGCDNSAMEVAVNLYNQGADNIVVASDDVHILPREVLGKPTVVVAMLLERWLPLWAVDKVMVVVARVVLGNLTKLGLRRPATGMLHRKDEARGRVLVLDHGALKLIRDGKIVVAPAVARFGNGQAELVDGRTLDDIDSVVLATGYRSNVPQANWHGDRSRYPATAFPYSWDGYCGLYAVGFSRRGYCVVSTQAMGVAEKIGRAWMERAQTVGDGNENDALVIF